MAKKSKLNEFDFEALKAYMTAFWKKVLDSAEPVIPDPVRYMLRAAYRKRATFNRAKVRTGDLFEEDALGTLNVSFELVAFDTAGRIYLEQRPSLKQGLHEQYPNRWAGMGVVINHYEKPQDMLEHVVKKFAPARIVKAVPVYLDGIFPYHVFDPYCGPFVLHVITVLLEGVPKNPRGRFFTREEVFQLKLMSSYRHIIFPAALKWYDKGGFGIGSEVYDLDAMRTKK